MPSTSPAPKETSLPKISSTRTRSTSASTPTINKIKKSTKPKNKSTRKLTNKPQNKEEPRSTSPASTTNSMTLPEEIKADIERIFAIDVPKGGIPMIALQGRGMGDMKEQFRRGMEGCIRDKLRQFKHSMSLGSEKEIEEDLIAMGITGRGSRGKGKWKDFEVVDSEEGEDGREV